MSIVHSTCMLEIHSGRYPRPLSNSNWILPALNAVDDDIVEIKYSANGKLRLPLSVALKAGDFFRSCLSFNAEKCEKPKRKRVKTDDEESFDVVDLSQFYAEGDEFGIDALCMILLQEPSAELPLPFKVTFEALVSLLRLHSVVGFSETVLKSIQIELQYRIRYLSSAVDFLRAFDKLSEKRAIPESLLILLSSWDISVEGKWLLAYPVGLIDSKCESCKKTCDGEGICLLCGEAIFCARCFWDDGCENLLEYGNQCPDCEANEGQTSDSINELQDIDWKFDFFKCLLPALYLQQEHDAGTFVNWFELKKQVKFDLKKVPAQFEKVKDPTFQKILPFLRALVAL